jgi:ATP-dependent helicase/nuclease subunit A
MKASGNLKVQAACAKLDLLRDMGRALPPFAFYARLLGPRGGRRAFLARLGPEAGDALDEFLNLALAHQRERAPSLGAFLAEVEALDVSIKRDMDLSEAYVRVMTAHAAKGLEGKIVFLPDTCGAPGGNHDGKLFPMATVDGRIFPVWSPNKASDCAVVAQAREARREAAAQEYRRLLYVAMTRAEERLYIAGHRGKKELSPESWREMIARALAGTSFVAQAPWGGDDKVLLFGPESPREAPETATARAPASAPPEPPSWLFAPAPAEFSAAPPLRPSGALEGAEEDYSLVGTIAASRLLALEEGRQLHRLFQFLPELAPALRRDAALRDLAARKIDPGRAEFLVDTVLRVLDDARLAPLFGENAIAEARIAARLQRPAGGFVDIAGAIDRLAERGDAVWVADFKTGAAQSTPAAHVAQMALYRAAVALLYPGRIIRCFLIHTFGPRVEEIEAFELEAALAEALAKAPARNAHLF